MTFVSGLSTFRFLVLIAAAMGALLLIVGGIVTLADDGVLTDQAVHDLTLLLTGSTGGGLIGAVANKAFHHRDTGKRRRRGDR